MQALQGALNEPLPLMRTILSMWFARDHGLVNAWGHGLPANADNFRALGGQKLELMKRFERLDDAIQVSGLPDILVSRWGARKCLQSNTVRWAGHACDALNPDLAM